jgi:hypothetical protein
MSALAGLSYWRGHSTRAAVLGGIAVFAACGALLFPQTWSVVFRLWMRAAEAIAWLATRLMLALFFYGILTPIALLCRLAGRRPLDTAFRDGRASYWRDKPAGVYDLARYEKQH